MKASTIWDKRWLRRVAVIVFWTAVWQALSMVLPKLLFAGPAQTVRSLFSMLRRQEFWLSIGCSLAKITLGFGIALVLGCLLAAVCARYSWCRVLLEPAVQGMKSVPVACFVAVALIWMRSEWISVLTAFFVAFPIIYINLGQGLSRADWKMQEMAAIFRLGFGKRLRAVWLPEALPYLLSACGVSVGMALKAGIAGEIIGLPARSIGEQLFLSKQYLNTGELFAWSIVVILLSALLEKQLVRVFSAALRRWEAWE